MTVTYRDFIHPEDDRARRELEAVPGFDVVTKCFLKFGVEQFVHGLMMARCVRLSKKQLPDIYGLLPPVAEKFGIEEPEFYLEMNPIPNAYTMGDTRRFLVVTSGILKHITDRAELESIIAHECGHIVCRHVFYMTMARMLATVGESIGIPQILFAPVGLAFNYWARRSELSADRASAVYSGSADPIVKSLLRLTGGPADLTAKIDVAQYAAQALAYDELQANSAWHKILQGCAVMNEDHPFPAVRIHEIMRWADSEEFKRACRGWVGGLDSTSCAKCGKSISREDRFCCHCGHPTEKKNEGK